MTIQRLISEKQGKKLKDLNKFKKRTIDSLSLKEKDELFELIAKKLNLILEEKKL